MLTDRLRISYLRINRYEPVQLKNQASTILNDKSISLNNSGYQKTDRCRASLPSYISYNINRYNSYDFLNIFFL